MRRESTKISQMFLAKNKSFAAARQKRKNASVWIMSPYLLYKTLSNENPPPFSLRGLFFAKTKRPSDCQSVTASSACNIRVLTSIDQPTQGNNRGLSSNQSLWKSTMYHQSNYSIQDDAVSKRVHVTLPAGVYAKLNHGLTQKPVQSRTSRHICFRKF